jgi:hypothetical protein
MFDLAGVFLQVIFRLGYRTLVLVGGYWGVCAAMWLLICVLSIGTAVLEPAKKVEKKLW